MISGTPHGVGYISEETGVKVVAYADDMVLLIRREFLLMISDFIELDLAKFSTWARGNGLG